MTPTTTTSFSAQTSSSSLLLLSPLYETSRRAGNYDNVPPSTTLHANRPIPIMIEEDPTPASASVCQQSGVEIYTDGPPPIECRDVAVDGAARSRPVTGRRTRVSVRGRTISMPSRRPVNVDVTNDCERHLVRLIPPMSASATAKVGLGQLKEVGAPDELDDVPDTSVSSPRTQGDGARGCGVMSLNAAVSVSASERPSISSRRSMSHVTPDFDPPPPPPTIVTSQQVRQIHPDDHRPVRPRKTRDDPDATSKAELDAARRRYFSIAEWNRQKVYHLRRASLRRACLTGIPLSWTHQGGPPDRRRSRDGATTKCRRRKASRQTTAADSERRKPQSTTAEIQPKLYCNQSLPPISEKPSVVSNNIRANRRRGTTKPDHRRNQHLAMNQDDSVQSRAIVYTCSNRCPPIPPSAHRSRPTYTTSHMTPRSLHKEPEANEQTVTAHVQQKPEANDSGLDSDVVAREHQSMTAANVDLQRVKDVLENPPSRGRTHIDDGDSNEDRNNEATCDKYKVDSANCVEHVESDNARQTADLTRYELI